MPAQKLRISFRCPVPARILHKGIICPEIHAHRFPAMGTMRNQLRGNCPTDSCSPEAFRVLTLRFKQLATLTNLISLRQQHISDAFFIIPGFLTAGLTALEQSIIPLRIKQPMLIKPAFPSLPTIARYCTGFSCKNSTAFFHFFFSSILFCV